MIILLSKIMGGGGCDCDAMISSKLSFLCSTHLGAS